MSLRRRFPDQSAKSRVERAVAFGPDVDIHLSFKDDAEFRALGEEIIRLNAENIGLYKVEVEKQPRKTQVQISAANGIKRNAMLKASDRAKAHAQGKAQVQARIERHSASHVSSMSKTQREIKDAFQAIREHKSKMSSRRQTKLITAKSPERILLRAINHIETRLRASVDIYAENDQRFLDLIREKAVLAPGREDIRIHKHGSRPSAPVVESSLNHIWR